MKTYIPKGAEINNKSWWVVDASELMLGRLATQVAVILRGKHRPEFTPHLDAGDFVVVINADKMAVSGDKINQKQYFRHSTRPGGGKFTSLRSAMATRPEWVVRKAVWGMLPHNPLGRKLIRKLKVYSGAEHPHTAQQPKLWQGATSMKTW